MRRTFGFRPAISKLDEKQKPQTPKSNKNLCIHYITNCFYVSRQGGKNMEREIKKKQWSEIIIRGQRRSNDGQILKNQFGF